MAFKLFGKTEKNIHRLALKAKCTALGHKWEGCTCTVCSEVRDEGHDWEGVRCYLCSQKNGYRSSAFPCGQNSCPRHVTKSTFITEINDKCFQKCKRCGKLMEGKHQMRHTPQKCYDTCSICGYQSSPAHKWNWCTCSVCGLNRDNHHLWTANWCDETCSICGKKQKNDTNHHWVRIDCSERCSVCGKTREIDDSQHDWVRVDCTEHCRICGKTREIDDSQHDWVRVDCTEHCRICGKQRESHDYITIETIEYGIGKCPKIYYSDDYACNFCDTPEACLKYPAFKITQLKCTRCGHIE